MKTSWKDILRYRFDNMMAKGAVALVGILFLATAIVIVITGIISFALGAGTAAGSVGENIWLSIMHVIDPGTITAAATDDISFIVLMSIVTLCGIFITSILIGIITTGFEEKLSALKKGNSRVIEDDHTLILGFNDSIFTIISELVEANANRKDACIVILDELDMESMEEALSKQDIDFQNTRIICRSGSVSDIYMLQRCSIESCRSVIINVADDFLITKTILAINNYFLNSDQEIKAHVVATVSDAANYEVINIAGGKNVELVLVEDTISRIIAQTCRQPGLSNVLIDLFDYSGDEFYFENFPELAGHKFADVLHYFEKAIVFGYKRGDDICLNPAKDTILNADDMMILLVEDDGMAKPQIKKPELGNLQPLLNDCGSKKETENILILGINSMLERILLELDNYFEPGIEIYIAEEQIPEDYFSFSDQLQNIKLDIIECDINLRANLDNLLAKDIRHVLVLSSDGYDTETSDSMTLLKLIHLRDIAQKQQKVFNITSEMKNIVNQKLAQIARVNDLVVGSNIINLILTQISENRDLASVFREILQADGSEIYLRRAENYVKLGQEIDFYQVTEIVKDRNEIAVGYKKQAEDSFEIITNPIKSDKIIFEDGDCIVVFAED